MQDSVRREQGENTCVLLLHGREDFTLTVEGFLRRQQDLEVLDAICPGEDPVAKAVRLRPCVVLVDLEALGLDSLVLIGRLRRAMPSLGIVALSLSEDDAHRLAVRQAGADALVFKAHLIRELMPAVRGARQPNWHSPPRTPHESGYLTQTGSQAS